MSEAADSPTAPPAEHAHQRPDLTPEPCKPDVLVRLRKMRGRSAARDSTDTLTDAIDVITGLRESDARRLQEINRLKDELRQHKGLLLRVTQGSEWSLMEGQLHADIEAAIAKPIVIGETPT